MQNFSKICEHAVHQVADLTWNDPLDIFTKLPSLKAYFPTAYFIQFFLVFLHCKPSLVRFCKSLHICNSTVRAFQKWKCSRVFTIFSLYNWILNNKRVFKIPNSVVIFKQIRQNKEVDLPPTLQLILVLKYLSLSQQSPYLALLEMKWNRNQNQKMLVCTNVSLKY